MISGVWLNIPDYSVGWPPHPLIEKMAGKADIAWRFVTDAACLVSVPSSISLLAGGNVSLPLGTWQLAEALTCLGEALTGTYCCPTQSNTGTVSSFHTP